MRVSDAAPVEDSPPPMSVPPDRLRSVSDSTIPIVGGGPGSETAADASPGTVSPSGATTVSLQLRWGDMDVNKHVNNVQFARLLEESRVRTFAEWFEGVSVVLPILVARQIIEFRAVLEYSFDPVTITTGVSRIGRTSYTMSAVLTDPSGLVCAVAETTLVAIDPSTSRPRPLSDDARAILASHRIEPQPMHTN